MTKYLVIIHKWFTNSEGWEIHEIEAKDDEHARQQAIVIDHDIEAKLTLSKCAYKVIPLAEGVRPRRLTFKERLFGEISAT